MLWVVLFCAGALAGCSSNATSFYGTWYEYPNGAPGIKVTINAEGLDISGPGVNELGAYEPNTGSVPYENAKGGPFHKATWFTFKKDADLIDESSGDAVFFSVAKRDCSADFVLGELRLMCWKPNWIFDCGHMNLRRDDTPELFVMIWSIISGPVQFLLLYSGIFVSLFVFLLMRMRWLRAISAKRRRLPIDRKDVPPDDQDAVR